MSEKPISGVPDSVLIRDIAAGKTGAFDTLYDRYRNNLLTYLTRYIDDRQGAEDVFQEAFFEAYTRIREGKYTEEGNFAGWLFTIASNCAKHYAKKKKRLVLSLDAPSAGDDGDRTAAVNIPAVQEKSIAGVEENEHERLLRETIAGMPERQREILILSTVRGLTYKEIARIYSITVPAAGMRVQRAREALYAACKKRGLIQGKEDVL